MREIQLRDAKAGLSAVIDDAAKGNPAIITRHGKPAAVIISFAEWQKLSSVPSFATLLAAIPASVEFERDQTPMPVAKF